MLWLCVHLPDLPLAIFLRGGRVPEPVAVSHGQGREQRVLIANRAALHQGVRPGMRMSAAHALVQGLRVHAQDARAESRALEHLAAWCGQFTSLVSLVPPQALLLEVQGSLTLFGGLEALLERLRRGLAGLGYSVRLAAAPTPLAATWLARSGTETYITANAALAGALSRLPLADVDLAEAALQALRGMGVRTVGDCLRLPRAGLARRFGKDLVLALDRALGGAPDPRAPYVAPATFEAALVLPGPIDNAEGLLFPLNRLIQELCGVLTARVAGVVALTLALRHPKAAPTRVELGLVAATRDARHLAELFRERLARVALPEPVEEVALVVAQLVPLAQGGRDFFAAKLVSSHCHSRESGNPEFTCPSPPPIKSFEGRLRGDSIKEERRSFNTWTPALHPWLRNRRIPAPLLVGVTGAVGWGERSEPQRRDLSCHPREAGIPSNAELIERLRSRLGNEAVRGIRPVAEHRPELAWRYTEPGESGATVDTGERPLWLFPEPVALEIRDGRPWLGEELTFEGSRERIESGWWDGRDMARDYFIARNRRGERFWIYRELATHRWWLHGVFG